MSKKKKNCSCLPAVLAIRAINQGFRKLRYYEIPFGMISCLSLDLCRYSVLCTGNIRKNCKRFRNTFSMHCNRINCRCNS